jgi:hypothetical protein
MGGFTEIFLKNKSLENIREQNTKLKEFGIKQIHFYSIDDIHIEYEVFKKNEGVFPEHFFPREKINSFNDFTKYWSTEALGACFVPHNGSLTFDCYFGRTSYRQMNLLRKYLMKNINEIDKVSGSFSTFVERGSFTKKEINQLKELKFI